ncbi:mannose-6-phosphate isomerase, class I [Microbacterium sp. 179-I 3D4 NHS]|uniref:mannose-6-phosphate isomerase, class I n=1 Tax=Microbacterium sp. 179-I 3D4 NHS TaxID=3142381 RepID=UPI00399F3D04
MRRLDGHVKNYDWGSPTAIPQFAGWAADGVPVAEVWFGAHPSGPSLLDGGGTLAGLLAAEPDLLGPAVRERFGELPFLLKLLAPGRAVSLQVHPHIDRAREQFSAPDAASTFVDANHKPEMILAVSPFDGLVGLRPFDEALRVLRSVGHPSLDRAADEAERGGDLRRALRELAAASEEQVRASLEMLRDRGAEHPAFATAIQLAEQHPNDAGALVSLLLERVSLRPGDAVFVDSGVPHAYISGLAVEIMANSDNVFRLGLTSKTVDVEESLRNLITEPARIIRAAPASTTQTLETDAAEFRLTVHRGHGLRVRSNEPGPRIVLGAGGFVALRRGEEDRRLVLSAGEAVFLGHGEHAELLVDGQAVVGAVPH